MKHLLPLLFAFSALTALAAESDLTLTTPTGEIHGTLTVPDEAAKSPRPLVLIVAGSGPTDRDGNNSQGLRTDCYRQLAAELARAGIASVRYDKRGIATSRAAGPKETDLRFETYAMDIRAWAALLRGDARFSSLHLLGHSEGAQLVALAAPQVRPATLIILCGAGQPAAALLREQLEPKLPADLWAESNQIITSLEQGKPWARPVSPVLRSLFRPSVQPYLISWFRHDPAQELRAAPCPVLLVYGKKDLQVPIAHAERLRAARPDAKWLLLDDMNHVLKTDHGDLAAQLRHSYSDPSLPLADGLVNAIGSFVLAPER